MMELQAKLEFYFKHNLNVLLVGRHGIGKTALVTDTFKNGGLSLDGDKKYLYFSAATMDVWCDLIGVPEKIKDESGYYLDYIRPRSLDQAEAIFFDELNRPSSKKILDAIMEFTQFKSINGRKFPNLKVIWGAINPEDDETLSYSVETLDPAQKDRFPICINIPYKPDINFFIKKFGQKRAEAAVSWWNDLSQEEKNLISPRRLEYALHVHEIGGDVRDVLPRETNISKFLLELKQEPISITLSSLFESKNIEESQKFLLNENNFRSALGIFIKNRDYLNFFFPILGQERKMALLNESPLCRKIALKNPNSFLEEMNLFAINNPSHSWTRKIKKDILSKRYFNPSASEQDLKILLDSDFVKKKSKTFKERKNKLNFIKEAIPAQFYSQRELISLEKILMNDIVNPSQEKSLDKIPEIGMILDHIWNFLYQDKKPDLEVLCKEYGKSCLDKIKKYSKVLS